jgi:hypothetical protein
MGAATIKIGTLPGGANFNLDGFGQITPWRSVQSGAFRWEVESGGKTLGTGTATLGHGVYDIVLLEQSGGVTFGIYPASAGRVGTSMVRFIHAAPELGSPVPTVDGRPAAKPLSFTHATSYLSATPGFRSLSAGRPGSSAPLIPAARVRLESGHAYSAIIVGSRGQMVRMITVTDRGAPLTRSGGSHDASSAAEPPPDAPASIVVRPGDSLWSIARSVLPAMANNDAIALKVVAIWDRNAQRIGTGDPNLIFPGTRLLLT